MELMQFSQCEISQAHCGSKPSALFYLLLGSKLQLPWNDVRVGRVEYLIIQENDMDERSIIHGDGVIAVHAPCMSVNPNQYLLSICFLLFEQI